MRTVTDIPDRDLIASYYVDGNIDDDCVVQRDDGTIVWMGMSDPDAEARWDAARGFWVVEHTDTGVLYRLRSRGDGVVRLEYIGEP